jgi:hypothetical protein
MTRIRDDSVATDLVTYSGPEATGYIASLVGIFKNHATEMLLHV